MKKILTILFFLPLLSTAQLNYSDTLRIVIMGDSHCGGANASPDDSSWRGRLVTYLQSIYPTVIVSKLCTGGETTKTAMPGWYNGSDPTKNIDSAIGFNPDFVFMEYSGNDLVVLGMNTTETKNNLRYLHDTLNTLGIRMAMTGMAPRQKTFTGGLTQQGYKDTSLLLNAWLLANYPDHYINIWDSLLRADNSGKAKSEYLSADSLHFNNTGHQKFYESIIANPAMEFLSCNCGGRAISFSMKKEGDSLRIQADDLISGRVDVSGSNDYSTFTPVSSFIGYTGSFDQKILGNVYMYYRVQIGSAYRIKITKTKQIN